MKLIELIGKYLESLHILMDEEVSSIFEEISQRYPELVNAELNEDISLSTVRNVLCEKYNLNKPNIKLMENFFRQNSGVNIGRNTKTALKKYLDYRTDALFELFAVALNSDTEQNFESAELHEYLIFTEPIPAEQIDQEFMNAWNDTSLLNETDRVSRKKDFILSLVSNVTAINKESMSVRYIFESNEELLPKVFTEASIQELEKLCMSEELLPRDQAIKDFYKAYTSLLKKEYQSAAEHQKLPESYLNQYYIDAEIQSEEMIYDRGTDIQLLPTEEYEMVYFVIDQNLFDRLGSTHKLMNHVLFIIKQSYRVLVNEKVLSIKVENIYDEEKNNLKWEVLSKLTIYAENFIEHEETSQFYKPEEIAYDMLTRFTIQLTSDPDSEPKEIIKLLKSYYKKKITSEELYSQLHIDLNKTELETYLEEFRYVHYGFDYNDCMILNRTEKDFPNGELQDIIHNKTELLVIFYKYRADQRRTPCPSCGSIQISGNSYPSINHRSWECKSPFCIDRSKSNRGKRYSKKSTFMQQGALTPAAFDKIPRELINKWRRDVVVVESEDEIEEMLVKYFSFTNEKLLFLNTDADMGKAASSHQRRLTVLSSKLADGYRSEIHLPEVTDEEKNFFDKGTYMDHFTKAALQTTDDKNLQQRLEKFLQKDGSLKIIEGHSAEILANMPKNILAAAVTSPPYYNAREYSQWPNLYLYFADMYKIIQEVYNTLKPGGVFLYNIADIADNENTVVKSKMGDKKLALGAYSIYFFLKAGFEMVDNIIWDKGEPQSNRQKNDGKFTPHYQKPLNAYEHMFIFKKPGASLLINEGNARKIGEDTTNIVRLNPVIKINSKGENLLGHTAPFPEDIPRFVAELFTTQPTDIILDPFSGSGTSALVAAHYGVGLGIELSSEYAQLSVKRCEESGMKADLFQGSRTHE